MELSVRARLYAEASKKSHPTRVKGPWFQIVIKRHNLSTSMGYVRVPNRFEAFDYIMKRHEVTLIDSRGRSWRLSAEYYPRRKYAGKSLIFRHGWSAFCYENNLEKDDLCTFKLRSLGEIPEFSIEVQKNQQLERKMYSPPVAESHMEEHQAQLAEDSKFMSEYYESAWKLTRPTASLKLPTENERILQSASLKMPQFAITILHPSCEYVHIPSTFEAFDYISKKREVQLSEPSGGRSWRVRVFYVCSEQWGRSLVLRTGWLAFCRSHKLEEGDMCTFRLISHDEIAEFCVEVLKKQMMSESKEDLSENVAVIHISDDDNSSDSPSESNTSRQKTAADERPLLSSEPGKVKDPGMPVIHLPVQFGCGW